MPEREGVRRGSAVLEDPQPLDGFGDRRNVSGWDPPQRENRALDRLKPLAAVAQGRRVRGPVDELLQRGERLPHRKVDRHPIVVRPWSNGSGVTVLGLQPPDESGRAIGKRVDRVELRAETLHDRMVDWRAKAADVDLSQMEK